MKRLIICLIALVALSGSVARAQTFSLAGHWRFHLDRADAGIKEQWFAQKLSDTIRLPGSLPEQGIGDDISVNTHWTGGIVDHSWFTAPEYAPYRQPGNIKIPFWLQPEKYYTGAAWFQRDIEIPKYWTDERIVLVPGTRPLGNARVGGRSNLSARTTASRRRTNTISAILAPGPHIAHHPRGQPEDRGHRREFPRHQ